MNKRIDDEKVKERGKMRVKPEEIGSWNAKTGTNHSAWKSVKSLRSNRKKNWWHFKYYIFYRFFTSYFFSYAPAVIKAKLCTFHGCWHINFICRGVSKQTTYKCTGMQEREREKATPKMEGGWSWTLEQYSDLYFRVFNGFSANETI